MGSALRHESVSLSCGAGVGNPPPRPPPPPPPSPRVPPPPRPPPPPPPFQSPRPPARPTVWMTMVTFRDQGESVTTFCSSSADQVMKGFVSQKSAAATTAYAYATSTTAPNSFCLTAHQ